MRPNRLILLIAFALGCSDAPVTQTSWVEDTPSGIPWVHNVGTGAWGDLDDPEVRLRVGSLDGPDEETFGSIGDLAVLPDGRLAILDTQVQLVRVFDSSGTYLYSFGGRGDGPGEFSYAVAVSSDARGGIWVSDGRRPALHEFSTDGRYLQSYSYPPGLAERILVRDEVLTTVLDSPDRDFSTDRTGATRIFRLGKDDELYRRSVYTFFKRTSPPPQMVLFDSADRNACTVRRSSTNTALQALLLMNDTQHLEAARHLAARAWQSAKIDDDRLDTLFLYTLARSPKPGEAEVLLKGLAHYRAVYLKDPEAAQSLITQGQSSPNVGIEPAEHAAWTMLATTVLNLDEMVTRP